MDKLLIAIDGHDGSGKTTITKILADKLNAKIVRPLDSKFGVQILNEYKNKNENNIMNIWTLCTKLIEEDLKDERIVVFDRNWMSVMTLLSEKSQKILLNKINIGKFKNFLCFANLDKTNERLIKRDDNKEKDWDNKIFIGKFFKIARENNVFILDTSEDPDPNDMVDLILQQLN